MARIYISSTYSDLAEARETVYRALRKMKHDVVAMEDYVATDQRPVDQCLSDVAACDVYLGIFAWRYGYTPPGQVRSITELEFREAVRTRKPCLLFLLHEDAPWPAKYIDQDRSRVNSLRDELCRDWMVSFFRTAEELSSTVSISVANLSALRQQQQEPGTNGENPHRALQYADIKVSRDNQLWIAGKTNPFCGDYVYPTRVFDWQWRYDFDLKIQARPEDVDPSLDITMLNTHSEPILITGIGIEVLSIGHISYSGASMPQALKVPVMDKYVIEMPDLMPVFNEERLKQELVLDLSVNVNSMTWGDLPDPIYVEAKAPYRYELLLKEFGRRVPRFTLLRLVTETPSGQTHSDNILFRRWM